MVESTILAITDWDQWSFSADRCSASRRSRRACISYLIERKKHAAPITPATNIASRSCRQTKKKAMARNTKLRILKVRSTRGSLGSANGKVNEEFGER